ncbi:MAG: hypothetical protein ACJ78Q_16605 [Chloroflexia bacterium]
MRTITLFPEQFELVNEQVAEVTFVHALSPEDHDAETLAFMAKEGLHEDYRACDLWIVLKDGRSFGFMAATPEFLRDYMERESALSFVLLGLLVISHLADEAILHALEHSLSQATAYEVESLGFRMISKQNDADATVSP